MYDNYCMLRRAITEHHLSKLSYIPFYINIIILRIGITILLSLHFFNLIVTKNIFCLSPI